MMNYKRQPADVDSINWENVPTWLIDNMIKYNKMPTKGISKYLFSSGPWEPEYFKKMAQKNGPKNLEVKFLNYEERDNETKAIA